MKIVKLEVSNFKRVKAVAIEPSGAVVQVRGQNGAGKSSVLDAVAAALGGEKLCPKEPVRRGAEGAVVRVELDGDLVVERRWTAGGGSSLKLSRKDGARYDKPQKRLDEILGVMSFDPLAFLRLPAKEQAETLRHVTGVDFSLLDGQRRAAYEDRTLANRRVTQLRARLATLPVVDAPDDLVSAPELLAEQQRRADTKAANDRRRATLDEARKRFQYVLEDVERVTQQVKKLREELFAAESHLQSLERLRDEHRASGAAMKAEVLQLVDPDLTEIPAKLREVEQVNERVRAKRDRAAAAAELAAAETEAKKLDDAIASIDEQKATALAQAKLPIPGLAFDEAGVRYEGLPLEQASQAQQLRVSVAMGAALNPTLRTMLVRDGSLLDERSLALLTAEAERLDLQVFLEMVGKDGDGIVIEDGEVAGADVPVAAAG